MIPDTIATRTLLVLVIGLTVSHLLSIAIYRTDQERAFLFTGGEHTSGQIANILQIVDRAPPGERARIIELADGPSLHVTWSKQSAIEDMPGNDRHAGMLRNALIEHFSGDRAQVFRIRRLSDTADEPWPNHPLKNLIADDAGDQGDMLLVSLQLSDLSWLNVAAPLDAPEPFWSFRSILSITVMLLAVVGLSALVVRRLSQPFRRFARAAERFGTNVKAPPMQEGGPLEVRLAVQAMNQMQGRIRRFVEDRTQMLAAISHDLGTPITRLRLRAEFVEDAGQRRKMLADLDDMEQMVSSALSFARDDTSSEPDEMVDLRSLLQRVCDEITDAGHDVTLDIGNRAVRYTCRPATLRRALTNLIGNAVKYGGKARVSLLDGENAVLVRIDDDGPGIPPEFQEEAFRPFRRLETSRNRETGGTGLGLSVARTIVRAHGGDISLTNRSDGGLRAEIQLPR